MLWLTLTASGQEKKAGFSFVDLPEEKRLELHYDSLLLTAYCYYDSVKKPILFPVKTISGITVTRGYPIEPRAGERTDHPHHTGLWFTYESVNGFDFWNNSTAIPAERRAHYGTIVHDRIVKKTAAGKEATLEESAQWKGPDQLPLLVENTQYRFQATDHAFIIDRTTTLRALQPVKFKDIKDGLLGIRVARELELPSEDSIDYLDTNGAIVRGRADGYQGVSGMYLSSEGLTGNDVWGTRARWVTLKGKINDKNISITIIDHRDNPGYPAYWHARGYGLFAVNPLGQAVFSQGKESLDLTLERTEAVTFRYRVMIHEGPELSAEQIDKMALQFGRGL